MLKKRRRHCEEAEGRRSNPDIGEFALLFWIATAALIPSLSRDAASR
jgi:hypothetical protein